MWSSLSSQIWETFKHVLWLTIATLQSISIFRDWKQQFKKFLMWKLISAPCTVRWGSITKGRGTYFQDGSVTWMASSCWLVIEPKLGWGISVHLYMDVSMCLAFLVAWFKKEHPMWQEVETISFLRLNMKMDTNYICIKLYFCQIILIK